MTKTKRIVSFIVAVALVLTAVLSLVACQEKYDCEKNGHKYGADGICTVCGAKKPDDGDQPVDGKGEYTYRLGPSDLPTAWNYHTYESNASTYVLDYTSDGLYTFDYSDDFKGYKIVPSMAEAFPEDVTSQYVGQYGVTAEDAEEGGKVYKIKLKQNLKFDNGEALTADDFVESMKLLLNPKAANFRADNVYQSGDLKIVGAEEYVKQGSYNYKEFVSSAYGDDEYIAPADFITTSEGTLQATEGWDIYIKIDNGGNWGSALAAYGKAGYLTKVQAAYDRLAAAADENGYVKLTASLLRDVQDCIACLHGYANVEEYAAAPNGGEYAYQEFEEMAFLGGIWDTKDYASTVGFFSDGDYNLVVVLKNAMEDNFYLRYELTGSFFLVYPDLYKKCISETGGVYSNSYGTSVDTFVGYGPYKLTTYVADNTIVLEKNPYWHGFSKDEYVEGTYQTTKIEYVRVEQNSTRMEMFLKGQLDSIGLQAEDIQAGYGSSEYATETDSESTWYIVMNPQFKNLSELQETATPVNQGYSVNKTILTIDSFRQALSYSVDRDSFIKTLNPTSGVANSLLSKMIVADPESGRTYRSLDVAKDTILSFWGLSNAWGEGKEYATRDEAIDSITGYDLNGAKTLFNAAYEEAVQKGYLTAEQIASGKWEVQIVIGQPTAAEYYTKSYEWFVSNWTDAVKGTKFEGHLAFKLSEVLGATSFGSALREGRVDLLHSVGYGGSMFNPYSTIDCYTGSLQYDPFTDKTTIDMDVTLPVGENGAEVTLRASLYDWCSEALQGETITAYVVVNGEATKNTIQINAGASADPSIRISILAKAEEAIMNLNNVFPLMTDASVSMRSKRFIHKTKDYVVGMGFGGVQYGTYAMDDAEWAAYVRSQGGTLSYK